MKRKDSYLMEYLCQAPVFLAMERAIECRLISGFELKRPILDLGCGDGLFGSIAFSELPDIGIDISIDELMKSLKRKAYKNTAAGDLSMLPLKNQSVSIIICNSVMEHVIDLKGAISEAYRVLFPGGKFILTIPTENYEKFLLYPRILEGLGLKSLAGRYRETVKKKFKHRHAYPAARWIKTVEDGGFKVLKTIKYCPRNVLSLNDFYLPFSFLSLLNKKIFKRWILCPFLRKYIAWYMKLFLRKVYFYNDSSDGARMLIEAERL